MELKDRYNKELKKKLQEDLKIENVMAVPKITKVVINVGAGEAVQNKNVLDKIQEQIGWISGQKPIITKARKSVSAFKIRKGLPIGAKITLRGFAMYEFLQKLISIVMPRMRDFRGIDDSVIDWAHFVLLRGRSDRVCSHSNNRTSRDRSFGTI